LASKEKPMLYVVRFTDKPNSADQRKALLPSHLEWLDRNKDTILVAGSLRMRPGDDAIGGLWVVEAADQSAVEKLFQTDPFWASGLRQSHEILHWSIAFPGRSVSL
jgi:hypothetical protein